MIITIVAFLGILALLILTHEAGHFASAKAFGIKIEEFGLGFPPRLIGVRRGETLYSLNAIPLGGFVKMAGEQDPKASEGLTSKGIATRLVVLSAGSIMNALLPIALFSIVFMLQSEPFWRAIPMGLSQWVQTFILFKNAVLQWITTSTIPQMIGPVGIAQLTGEVAKAGISPLLEFTAFISINLAIINVFPLPALDGGRIVFVLLEWVRRGKRVSPRIEGLVHAIGFALLMVAILVITQQDIMRIISGGS